MEKELADMAVGENLVWCEEGRGTQFKNNAGSSYTNPTRSSPSSVGDEVVYSS